MNKETLVYESTPHIQEVASELISLTPEHWNSFYADARVTSAPNELENIKIIIRSNEGYDEIVFPSDGLINSIFKIFDSFKPHFRLQRFKITDFIKDDGKWGYETEFDFSECNG